MSALPTGRVTFLFTGIAGSTRLWDEHPDAMRAAMVPHDRIIESGVHEHGGAVVRPRGEGDSRFAVSCAPLTPSARRAVFKLRSSSSHGHHLSQSTSAWPCTRARRTCATETTTARRSIAARDCVASRMADRCWSRRLPGISRVRRYQTRWSWRLAYVLCASEAPDNASSCQRFQQLGHAVPPP